ncbi:MAG: proline dehydrogenase family protein [Thermomicrobiales bacterium]
MLRPFFIYLSHQEWGYRLLLSNPLTRAMAWRFVAGEQIDDALAAVRALNAKGIRATLDQLGENVTSAADAVAAASAAIDALEQIHAARVESHISVKLTHFGFDLSPDLCRAQLRRVLARARDLGNFVRIDMEGSPYTQATLDLFDAMRDEFGAETVGIVIQSYLRRSQEDIACLIASGSRVRLVKGAYDEPATIAYPHKDDVDRAYRIQMEQLLARGNYPALATHDERLIGRAQGFAAAEGIGADRFEFQMLYGIRRDLQERLAHEGYNVRCYVPYGTQWYPYFMRRLAERPANLIFIAGNLLRR